MAIVESQTGESQTGSRRERLRERIENGSLQAGVMGLGYVGLPLAVELGRSGYSVVGLDRAGDKVAAIERGECYIPDVNDEEFQTLIQAGKLRATVDESALAGCNAVSICVPTPLRKTRDPDLSYVMDSAETLAANMQPGTLVILESTTYPGTTEEAILPVLERSGMRVGEDFFLCFSPERVDPGNERFGTRQIPKVIGGVTEACTELGCAYYGKVMDTVVPVSSPRVAEMVKLLENTFRMINIGLANEMAIMCHHMGINVWEVIESAATKPFGFMPFYPGPGLGGHCIPVDPHYLSWKIKQIGYEPRFIQLASEINGGMPAFIVSKIQAALNDREKAVKGSHVHLVGVAYKRDISDVRESPALDIIGLLERLGAKVTYSDPYVSTVKLESGTMDASPLEECVDAADCVAIITDHRSIDYPALLERSKLIVDSRNALRGVESDKIVRL
ncbi:MAG: nucleotide sugar dehydrogenase [Acidobacteria bacterium]|nr:nucleotide sugar dehydrogenase [Acidobacteriota bacterium]